MQNSTGSLLLCSPHLVHLKLASLALTMYLTQADPRVAATTAKAINHPLSLLLDFLDKNQTPNHSSPQLSQRESGTSSPNCRECISKFTKQPFLSLSLGKYVKSPATSLPKAGDEILEHEKKVFLNTFTQQSSLPSHPLNIFYFLALLSQGTSSQRIPLLSLYLQICPTLHLPINSYYLSASIETEA